MARHLASCSSDAVPVVCGFVLNTASARALRALLSDMPRSYEAIIYITYLLIRKYLPRRILWLLGLGLTYLK